MNHPMLQQVERSFNDHFRTDSIVSELADQAMKGDYSRISLDSILEREVDSETFTNLSVKLREAHSQGAHPQVLMDMFNALMKAGINVRLIDQGSSELNIIVGVDNLEFENAVRALYRAFVVKENNRW